MRKKLGYKYWNLEFNQALKLFESFSRKPPLSLHFFSNKIIGPFNSNYLCHYSSWMAIKKEIIMVLMNWQITFT